MHRTRILLIPVVVLGTLSMSGCGSLGETALQSGEATLRSLLDLLLTDLANQVADAFDGDMNAANGNDNGSQDGDGDGDGGDGDGDGGDGDGDGDGVTAGETLVADNCAACHGADGASGFAPNIQGQDADTIAATVGGAGGHTVIELTEQEIADIEAYLASF